jgi:hypothetical protein
MRQLEVIFSSQPMKDAVDAFPQLPAISRPIYLNGFHLSHLAVHGTLLVHGFRGPQYSFRGNQHFIHAPVLVNIQLRSPCLRTLVPYRYYPLPYAS